jgi:transposase
MTIGITRECDAAELRKLARRERDGKVTSRLLAIAAVLEGANRTVAARQAGPSTSLRRIGRPCAPFDRLRRVHRFNAQGVAGLSNAPKGRPKRRLTAVQEAEIRARVLKGPDPETDGLVRWRCVDIQTYITETYAVKLHVRTVGSLLHRLRLSHVSVRPLHPKGDAEAQAAFKKTSRLKSKP